MSTIFCKVCPDLTSPILKVLSHNSSSVNSPKHQELMSPRHPNKDVLFILTKNAHIHAIDSVTGTMISSRSLHPKKESSAISMFVIDGGLAVSETGSDKVEQLSQENDIPTGHNQTSVGDRSGPSEVEVHSHNGSTYSIEGLPSTLILLCCEDALRLYPLKSVMLGEGSAIHKVKLIKPCCWTTTFKRKDEKAFGLALLYQTGVLEIRSLPDLGVVGESSLMEILRWNFKANMTKTMNSSESGQITVVNGCELAFISLLADENDFRIPDSLPCLHDKVLAAAADAAISVSSYQKNKQGATPGILGGIIKGFKGVNTNVVTEAPKSSIIDQLESTFSKVPFSVPSTIAFDGLEDELDIDDIEIDETPHMPSTVTVGKHEKRDEETEREKLFQGATSDMKPRVRTAEEIRAQYRKTGDAASAAADAKDKLLQRQEKLERISRRTAELESGAESFASMANELVKVMERRKWWQI